MMATTKLQNIIQYLLKSDDKSFGRRVIIYFEYSSIMSFLKTNKRIAN